MNLFEIDAGIRNKLDAIYGAEDSDGVIAEDDFSELEALNLERKAKLESIALYIKEAEAEATAIKNEIKNLSSRAKTAENKAERLKNYLSQSLILNNEREFSSPKVKLSFRKSESVVCQLENLPQRFIIEKVDHQPDKKAIKEALKAGEEVEGAFLEVKENLQIK